MLKRGIAESEGLVDGVRADVERIGERVSPLIRQGSESRIGEIEITILRTGPFRCENEGYRTPIRLKSGPQANVVAAARPKRPLIQRKGEIGIPHPLYLRSERPQQCSFLIVDTWGELGRGTEDLSIRCDVANQLPQTVSIHGWVVYKDQRRCSRVSDWLIYPTGDVQGGCGSGGGITINIGWCGAR